MNKPQMKAEAVRKIVSDHGITDKIVLVGIRGYFRDTMGKPGQNDIGMYDDAIFLVTPEAVYNYNANTDPSKRYPAIASLVPGVHPYRKGNHGISKPGGGYPAFRPATPDESLPVTRDGQKEISKGIAINIHKGGFYTTSSAGCQTLPPDEWTDFQPRAYYEMTRFGQKIIQYILIVQ